MLKFVTIVKKLVIAALILMLLISVVLGTIALGRSLMSHIMEPPFLLLEVPVLFDAFGLFLVIVIGIELLKSMMLFLSEDRIAPDLVAEVAIIALCNKIITLDMKDTSGDTMLGIAAMLIGLAASYFVFRSKGAEQRPNPESK